MKEKQDNKIFQIRNSTADFLIFAKENGADNIEVRVEDNNVWMTTESLAKLYGKGRSTISEHLKAIYSDDEQDENSTCRNFRQVAS
ncbi:MAG: cell filamentation protein Fic, partial [Lactococcus sp.]